MSKNVCRLTFIITLSYINLLYRRLKSDQMDQKQDIISRGRKNKMARKIYLGEEKGKIIIDLGYGRKREFPPEEPIKELTYDLLKFFQNSTAGEIAMCIGWDIARVRNGLNALSKNRLITYSPCFEKKITWIKPPPEEKEK